MSPFFFFFLNEQSHTPSSRTSRDSLDPVLLTPDYAFAHVAIPKSAESPRHREEQGVDYTRSHTQTPVIVTADHHLPPGFIPTSPSFVPLVLGEKAKAAEGEGVRGAYGNGEYAIYAGRAMVPEDVTLGRGVFNGRERRGGDGETPGESLMLRK